MLIFFHTNLFNKDQNISNWKHIEMTMKQWILELKFTMSIETSLTISKSMLFGANNLGGRYIIVSPNNVYF